jgi:hypothetical protein
LLKNVAPARAPAGAPILTFGGKSCQLDAQPV